MVLFAAEKRHLAPKWVIFPQAISGLSLNIELPSLWTLEKTVYLETYHHLIKVSRSRIGESIMLVDCERKKRFLASIENIEKDRIYFALVQEYNISPKPQQKIIACCAIIKPERWEWMLEKLVELGIGTIQPLVTQYVQGQFVEKFKQPKYQARLEDIIVQSAQQCEQDCLPLLLPPVDIADLSGCVPRQSNGFVLSERSDGQSFRSCFKQSEAQWGVSDALESLRYVVGPEGGWAPEEIHLLLGKGYSPVTIAGNILRAETASIYAASIMSEYIAPICV